MTPEPEPIIVEPVIDDARAELADIRQVMETLRAHARLSETRHTEILDGVAECQLRIDQIQASCGQILALIQAENPQITQILTQVSEVRGELSALTAPPITPVSQSTPSLPQVEPQTLEPAAGDGQRASPEAPPVAKRKRLYIRV
jgi:hypothetical protein